MALEDKRYDAYIRAARNLIVRFPEAQRSDVAERITEALSKLDSVYVTPKEALKDIALDNLAQTNTHHMPLFHIHDLAEDIRRLANVIPGMSVGESAGMLHDLLQPLVGQKAAKPRMQVEHAQVQERVSLPPNAELAT